MSLIELVKYFPYLLELIRALKDRIDQEKLDRKVHDDIKLITEAFSDNDSDKLNRVLNGLPEPTDSKVSN